MAALDWGLAALKDAAEARFAREFGLARPEVEIFFANRRGGSLGSSEPPQPDPSSADSASWVRFVVRQDFGLPDTFGRGFRNGATAVIQVFTPEGSGEGWGDEISEAAGGVMAFQAEGLVRFLAARQVSVGPDGHGWWQHNVEVPMVQTGVAA